MLAQQPMPVSDPRVFFASERTLLAWLRTGIAIVGLGFVVSRFGLFLHLVAAQAPGRPTRVEALPSALLGAVFVVVGAVAVAAATVQHGRFIATLPEVDRPASYSRSFALWLSALVSTASFLLAAYLLLTLP
jgi:putative membrane protein